MRSIIESDLKVDKQQKDGKLANKMSSISTVKNRAISEHFIYV